MTEATLQEALEEIETTQRKNTHLLEAGRLKPETCAYKNRRLARAHKVLTFFIANQDWILAVHQSRERMRREAELLCETDPDVREVLEAFADAEVTDVRALSTAPSDSPPSSRPEGAHAPDAGGHPEAQPT